MEEWLQQLFGRLSQMSQLDALEADIYWPPASLMIPQLFSAAQTRLSAVSVRNNRQGQLDVL